MSFFSKLKQFVGAGPVKVDHTLPPHVHNAQALDAWYGKLPPDGKAKLEWAFADLMVGDESDATRFPPCRCLIGIR